MLLLLALMSAGNALAVPVRVTMNNVSRTMTLANKTTGGNVDVGTPSRNSYEFNADPGTYVLTAYASDATTVNGTIEIAVGNTAEKQSFSILTCTAYATNTDWTVDNDYTIEVQVNSREGEPQAITLGNSSPAGRKTFLALNGNSYHASLIPNAAHQAEGYMPLHRSGTLTFNANVSGNIPMGADYSVRVPADAHFEMGMKTSHFVKFTSVQPTASDVSGDVRTITYRLANGQVYNFRTWKEGGLTQGGYFTMNVDAGKVPVLAFTEADYAAFAPKTVKHDVKWNGGYETGDIFVNINERGHLKMEVGDTYDAHAMRTWQLTDNSTNNYFIEPDFHYTIINPDGTPSTGVIEIENAHTTTDPWTTIKAVGKGTAIVLVTYDAIGLNTYNANGKSPYMSGEYWSAIWPENTAAYVVTVGNEANGIVPNMLINETLNQQTKKNAGKNVDAEHDVFYYLDTQEGHTYTFKPEGVSLVEIAYPTIGPNAATYTGFSATGVTHNMENAGTSITNCLNTGTISGASQVATIVGNVANKAATVRNNLGLGKVVCAGTNSGNVYTGTFSGHENIRNNFVSEHYACGQEYETRITPQQLASGEIASLLGEAWGQEIGTDAYPRLGGKPVFKGISGYSNKDEDTQTYDLAVLTFEDADYKGDGKKQASGQANWSSLIAQDQGFDKMLYGEGGYGCDELFYFWDDSNNTSLHHDFPNTVAGYAYWFGGHAISHYVSGEETAYGDNTSQLTVYKQGVAGMQTTGGGHNGSDNFAVHYGYYQAMGVTPALNFADGEARVIDHMYVNTTTYLLNTIRNGNSMTQKIGANDWIKIVATGTYRRILPLPRPRQSSYRMDEMGPERTGPRGGRQLRHPRHVQQRLRIFPTRLLRLRRRGRAYAQGNHPCR